MKKIKTALRFMILAILAGVICFPILFAVSGAFMQQWELAENLSPVLASGDGMASWSLLPRAPSLASLVELLLDTPQFFVMFWNSLKLACCIVGGQLLVGVPAAWSLARFRFPGSRAVSMIYLVLMLMAFSGSYVPGISGVKRDGASGYPLCRDPACGFLHLSRIYHTAVFCGDSGGNSGGGQDRRGR